MYRLHYSDLVRLAIQLNLIHKGRIPHNQGQWTPSVLMSLMEGNGAFIFTCDMDAPRYPIVALEDLAQAVSWKWS